MSVLRNITSSNESTIFHGNLYLHYPNIFPSEQQK